MVPSKEGESSKIKVKVRLDIHGVLTVVNASLVEKLAAMPEPEPEKMEVEGQEDKTTTADVASEVCRSVPGLVSFPRNGKNYFLV